MVRLGAGRHPEQGLHHAGAKAFRLPLGRDAADPLLRLNPPVSKGTDSIGYHLSRQLNITFAETETLVISKLAEKGFGVLTAIDAGDIEKETGG